MLGHVTSPSPCIPSRRHSPATTTHLIAMGTRNLTRNSPASMATASTTLLLSLSLALLAFAWAASPSPDAEAISRFQEYLRIDTAQPAPDYAAAVAFLRNQASEAGLEARTLELVAGKPLLLLRWPGRRPSLPSILLNSHTDVVPSEPNKWDHPPFSAALDEASGRIYARGSQVRCTSLLNRSLKAAIVACSV